MVHEPLYGGPTADVQQMQSPFPACSLLTSAFPNGRKRTQQLAGRQEAGMALSSNSLVHIELHRAWSCQNTVSHSNLSLSDHVSSRNFVNG